MSDILSIGAGATQLYRQSLATVSNNIANLNTEGYSRQVSSSAEGMPSQKGTVFLGTGARLQGIVRAYDEFTESSLRNSKSDLSTQEPLIQYANRIVDIMGSQTSGLSSALDQFFATASDLSADPASIIQRKLFVRDADALASRFRELAGHLGAIEQEARSSINLQVSTINTLSAQLVAVNSQLSGKISVDKQPPGLLDQRDKILRDLANISKIHVSESINGEVAVRLGSSSGSLIVDGKLSADLGVNFDNNDPGRVDIIIDPYGDARASSSVSSGVLGGLINFRSQTLGPAMDNLDYLAQTLVKEVNLIHTSGRDARGERGNDLFQIDSVFGVTSPTVDSDIYVEIEVVDPQEFTFSPFQIRWIAEDKLWRIEDGNTGAVTFSEPDTEGFSHGGLQLNAVGRLKDGDTFFIEPQERPSAGLKLIQTDPLAIAAAERLRVTASETNISESRVSLAYGQEDQFQGFINGTDMLRLGNNASTAASVEFAANNLQPSLVIPRGTDSVALMMEVPEDSNLRLQVLNSEGLHILGHSIDVPTQTAMLSGDTGFNAESNYNSSYLNKVGVDAYMDMDLTYGFLASSITQQEWVPNTSGDGLQEQTTTINAQKQTSPVRIVENASGSTVDLIAANSLMLNGESLAALTIADGAESSAATMATWLNSVSDNTGVTATAANIITASQDDIDLLQQVRINNVIIGDGSLPANIDDLSTAINAQSANTNVTSYVDRDGGLVLMNTAGYEGQSITLSNPDASSNTNALGQLNQTYAGSLTLDSSDEIRFTFGADGVPADLAVLGLRTGIYIDGTTSEDLAVFVTGSGNANIAAGFSARSSLSGDADEPPFSVDFISATQFSITDTATGTVVATRDYVAGEDIHYQSLTLSFDSAPQAGDQFVVDGNEGGIGDNGNMLLLVALQDKPVLANGRTFSDGYIDLVSTVGNKATLGKISQEALQVVYDQAIESRDQVSGVSLDQEAADLIRLQQAYQASAQIIQMSSKIFDSILGIR